MRSKLYLTLLKMDFFCLFVNSLVSKVGALIISSSVKKLSKVWSICMYSSHNYLLGESNKFILYYSR